MDTSLKSAAQRLALLLLLALSGCGGLSTAPQGPRVLLAIESGAIALDRGGGAYAVPWVVENRGSETAYLPRCGGAPLFEVERWENGRWVNARAALCITSLRMDPFSLAPGDALRGVEKIAAPGRYRLRLAASPQAGGEPRRLLASDPFTIP